jgi:hypothetical protein
MVPVKKLILSSVILFTSVHHCYAADLPVCSNRVINEVMKRSGCTVGDSKCWLTKGGFCMDYVEKRAKAIKGPKPVNLQPVDTGGVKKGDVAQFFTPRPHLAYVERVVKDKQGRPLAIDVSEYNFGSCWVDQGTQVTDTYKKMTKRSGIPANSVDGGFLRSQ